MELQKILSVRQNFLKLLLIFLSRHLFLQDALPKKQKIGAFHTERNKKSRLAGNESALVFFDTQS